VDGKRQPYCFWYKNSMVKKEVWDDALLCSKSHFFVAKIRCEVFANFQAVAAICHSSMRNWLFGLSGRILCQQFTSYQRNWWSCSWPCSSPVSHFWPRRIWTFRVLLMLSYRNACLIIARLSVLLFPGFEQTVTLFLCRFHRHINTSNTGLQIKGHKHLHFPPSWV
jgi:hypothetical protein